MCKEISGERQLDFVKKFDYVREAGTEGEYRAAAALQEELGSFGMTSHQEEFTFEDCVIEEASFVVTEPYEKEYRVTGYSWCNSTPDGGIEAPFLYVENGDEISLSHARGKIVLVNGPLRKKIFDKLVKADVAAFVSISGTPLDEGEDLIPQPSRLSKNWESPIQGVCIHYQDVEELVLAGASRARLTLKQSRIKRTSRNVIARIEGSDKPKEILTLTAHFDSVPNTPGAYDNMSGCAIIMELCRYFKNHQPRRTMEFVWFSGEEKGLLGSQEYTRVHEAELPCHLFNMNVDLAGQLVGGTVIGVTADPSICQTLTDMAWEIDLGMSTINNIWAGDSNTFAWKGIPAMTLNRDGFGMHTRHDTVRLISAWSLERSTRLLGHIAEQLGNLDSFPLPRRVPEAMIEQLDSYFKQ